MVVLASLFGAFMTGLVGGLHCVGMCGGFAAMAAGRGAPSDSVAYHVGRWFTYATLGFVVGTFGWGLSGLGWIGWGLTLVVLVALVARLLGWVGPTRGPTFAVGRLLGRASRRAGRFAPLILGMSTALLPCGLVYTALALPLVSGDPFVGAASMVAFGVGTTPLLSVVSVGSRRISMWSRRPLRLGLAALLLVVGVWQLVERIPRAEGEPASCCASTVLETAADHE